MPRGTRTELTRAIGARIRDERVRLGLTRKDFAERLGTSPDQITHDEQGYPMSDARLGRIARVLGRSFDYLRTGEGPRFPQELAAESGSLEREWEKLLRRVFREEVRKALEHYFENGSAKPRGVPRSGHASPPAGSSRKPARSR